MYAATAFPADEDAASAVRSYIDWLNTQGHRGEELGGATLNASSFVGANFRKADLGECEAQQADFTRASFVGASFYRTEIFGSCLRGAYLNAAWLYETDLRDSDLSGVWFGPGEASGTTVFKEARVRGVKVTGAGGWVKGTVDVGTEDRPHLVGGPELVQWFQDHGAPDVRVAVHS